MAVYALPVTIAATLYVKAASPEEALEIGRREARAHLVLADNAGTEEGPPISGAMFNSPDLPDVSLSPAMTLLGVDDGAQPEECEPDARDACDQTAMIVALPYGEDHP